jgi:hypothetical protein
MNILSDDVIIFSDNIIELVQWYEEDWNEQYKLKMEQKKKMNRKESTKVPVVDRQNDLKACPIMMKFYDCLQPLIVSCNSSNLLPIGCQYCVCMQFIWKGVIFRCGLIFECLFYFVFYTTHRCPYLCFSYIYRLLYSISQVYFIRTMFELLVEIFVDIRQMILSIVSFVLVFFLGIMRYFGELVSKCCSCFDNPSSNDERRPLLPNRDRADRDENLMYCCGKSTSEDDIENLFLATQAKIVISFNAW